MVLLITARAVITVLLLTIFAVTDFTPQCVLQLIIPFFGARCDMCAFVFI